MPRSGDGTYTLPGGTVVTTGDTLLVSQHNPPMQDIAAALTGSLDRDGNGGMRADLGMGSHKITALADGTDPTDAATVGQLSSGAGVPVGAIIDFAGSTAPAGWLVCGGQSLQREDYLELFGVIGTTYGSVNGTAFNLPDCRGRVAAGRDFDASGTAGRLTVTTMTPDGTTLGATGGAQTVTLTEAQLAAHDHALTGLTTTSEGSHAHTVPTTSGVAGVAAKAEFAATTSGADTIATSTAGAHTHGVSGTTDNAGGDTAHGNVQPTILMNKIIRASTS